jgi:hypothetical protein
MSGAFTIDTSTPTLRRNLNEHPIHDVIMKICFEHSTVLQTNKFTKYFKLVAAKLFQKLILKYFA